MVVNIEGYFVNQKLSRESIDIKWHHHPNDVDTFFVNQPHYDSFNFITAGTWRYMEFSKNKIKRQLGTHHLTETIGETPLKLDDMELLANGHFLCNDSLKYNPNILQTAFSMAWWSFIADTIPYPKMVTTKGAQKEERTFTIRQWKNYSGEMLPTLIKLESKKYSGEIWIRSAYALQNLQQDPLINQVKKKSPKNQLDLFKRIPSNGERKIPLVLKLNQELLRE